MNRVFAAIFLLFSLFARATGGHGDAVLIRAMNGLAVEGAIERDSVYSEGIFDFSGLQHTGRITARYFGRGDSIVMELMPDCRTDFATDSLGDKKIIRLEGRTWRAEIDSLAIDGFSTHANSASMSVDLSSRFTIHGVYQQKSYSGYTVIFEAGDTLRDVRLLCIDFHGNSKALYGDSLSSSLSLTRCYWFAPDSQWPVAVATNVDSNWGGEFQSLYLFPESMQSLAHENKSSSPTDSPYKNVTFKPLDNPTIARHVTNIPNVMRSLRSDTSDGFTADDIQTFINGNQLIIHHRDGDEATDFILCDLLGRTIPASTSVGNQITFYHLPTGDYILSYTINGERQSHKIYIPTTR